VLLVDKTLLVPVIKGSAFALRHITRKFICYYIISMIEKRICFRHLECQVFVQNIALLCMFLCSKFLDGWIFLRFFLKYAEIC
jgi:uncharacterized membrane protein YwaF